MSRLALRTAALVTALSGARFMWSLAQSPQLYADDWYARGGLCRTVQIVATDVLGPHGIGVAALAFVLLYIGPRRIVDVCRRALARPSTYATFVVVAIVAGLAAFAQPSFRASFEGAAKPNVLLLVVDSFRAEQFDARVTPNLAKLAAKGTRFDRAYPSTPEALPSWTTLLTGCYARRETRAALPEPFAKAGYATAVIGNEHVTGSAGGRRDANPALVADDVEDAIRRLGTQPFFAAAFFSTPRFPYASPAPYYARFADRAYRGRFKYDAGRDEHAVLDEADARQVRALHDGAVAAVDDAVGRIWESLERRSLAEHTILVVVGSHGTHVPLLVIDGRATKTARQNNDIVRDVDLAPTLYDLAGVAPPPNLDGRSLSSALKGESLEPRLAFAEAADESPVMRERTVRDERFKLLYRPTRTSPQLLLFDTASDPSEQRNVGATHPAELARLQDALWSWMLADPTMEKRDGYLLPKQPESPFKNVLWIAVDGLRSDAVIPAVDALARRGARFTDAYSSATPAAADKSAMLSVFPQLMERKGIGFVFASYSLRRAGTQEVDQQIDRLVQPLTADTIVVLAGSEKNAAVPIVLVAPHAVTPGLTLASRIRSIDIAPTLLDLLGIETPIEMRGASLLPLARGLREPERVIVSEGEGARTILHGPWRFVSHGSKSELFHLADDPAQAHDLASARPDVALEMKARLEAAIANVPVTSAESPLHTPTALVRLRFAGGGSARRVSGAIQVGDAKRSTNSYEVRFVDLGPEALRDERGTLDVAFRTSPARPVGFDIIVDPPGAPITWDLWLDDGPWPDQGVFAGRFGLIAPELRRGIATDDARGKAQAETFPLVDPLHDLGLFVTRDLKRE